MSEIERIIDRLIVRGDCLKEPCASEGWVKVRSVGIATVAAAPGLVLSLDHPTVGMAIALLGMFSAIKIVSARLNERIEQEGHTCDRSVEPDK